MWVVQELTLAYHVKIFKEITRLRWLIFFEPFVVCIIPECLSLQVPEKWMDWIKSKRDGIVGSDEHRNPSSRNAGVMGDDLGSAFLKPNYKESNSVAQDYSHANTNFLME